MAPCYVLCARPPEAANLREKYGMADAAEAIQKHHQMFKEQIGSAAASCCMREDECFALFPSENGDTMAAAVSAFVDACGAPLTPSTAIGIATGEFVEPSETRWSDVADSEDMAAARAMARIATANQVLATADVCASAKIKPLLAPTDRERRLHGLKTPIKVVIAPWGDVSQRQILNLPKLRPELKKLENTTADLNLQADDIRQALDAFSTDRDDKKLQPVKHRFKLLGVNLVRYLANLDEASELSHVPELRAQLSELKLMCEDLPRECDRVLDHIHQGNTLTSGAQLSDRWEDVLDLVRTIHLRADKMIMELDDGVTVGQPPGWRA